MDTSNLKVGDWVGDKFPCLILKIIDKETILVDEVFCRYLYHKRIIELKI
jgi:hypothetical protein